MNRLAKESFFELEKLMKYAKKKMNIYDLLYKVLIKPKRLFKIL